MLVEILIGDKSIKNIQNTMILLKKPLLTPEEKLLLPASHFNDQADKKLHFCFP